MRGGGKTGSQREEGGQTSKKENAIGQIQMTELFEMYPMCSPGKSPQGNRLD